MRQSASDSLPSPVKIKIGCWFNLLFLFLLRRGRRHVRHLIPRGLVVGKIADEDIPDAQWGVAPVLIGPIPSLHARNVQARTELTGPVELCEELVDITFVVVFLIGHGTIYSIQYVLRFAKHDRNALVCAVYVSWHRPRDDRG